MLNHGVKLIVLSCIIKYPFRKEPIPGPPLFPATDVTKVPAGSCAEGIAGRKLLMVV